MIVIMLLRIVRQVFSAVFPPKCRVCAGISQDALCKDCISKIDGCPGTFRVNDRQIFAASNYDGVMKKAIGKFKFLKDRRLARPLGEYFGEKLAGMACDVIIPVPLHQNRMKERGFNQCALLANVISGRSGARVLEDVLLRVKDTRPQFRLKKYERFANVAGAFEVIRPDAVRGKTVLLIDDIVTTGATISGCAGILLGGGAENVVCASLSRAVCSVL